MYNLAYIQESFPGCSRSCLCPCGFGRNSHVYMHAHSLTFPQYLSAFAGVAILFLASMELGYKTMLEEAGISIIHQKIFPSLNTLPKADKPLVKGLSEVERNRAVFQGAMDAAHYLQVRTSTESACLKLVGTSTSP